LNPTTQHPSFLPPPGSKPFSPPEFVERCFVFGPSVDSAATFLFDPHRPPLGLWLSPGASPLMITVPRFFDPTFRVVGWRQAGVYSCLKGPTILMMIFNHSPFRVSLFFPLPLGPTNEGGVLFFFHLHCIVFSLVVFLMWRWPLLFQIFLSWVLPTQTLPQGYLGPFSFCLSRLNFFSLL